MRLLLHKSWQNSEFDPAYMWSQTSIIAFAASQTPFTNSGGKLFAVKPSYGRTLLCLLAAGACFSTACGKTTISSKKAEKLITEFLDTKFELKNVKVVCPKNIKPEKGATFECVATTEDGHKLTALVTQTDNKGAVTWEMTKGLLELTISASAENTLKPFVSRALNVKDVEVTCPEKIEIKEGGFFDCTSEIDGVVVTTSVEQTSNTGAVSYKLSSGILYAEKLEILIQGALKGKNLDASVDCGQPIRLSKPGGTFECRATSEKETLTIVVSIKDNKGNVNWKIRPPAPVTK